MHLLIPKFVINKSIIRGENAFVNGCKFQIIQLWDLRLAHKKNSVPSDAAHPMGQSLILFCHLPP